MRKLVPISLVLLAGCGDLSNSDLEDLVRAQDREFALALPSAADVALDGPDEEEDGTSGLTRTDGLRREICQGRDPVDVFCNGHAQAVGINVLTGQILGLVDAIRKVPPTRRSRDLRAWGPYPDEQHAGRSWRAQVARRRAERDGTTDGGCRTVAGKHVYEWSIDLQRSPADDFVTVVSGCYVPGPGGTSSGRGIFTWNARAAREEVGDDGAKDLNLLEIRYDLVSDVRAIDATFTSALPDGSDGYHLDFGSRRGPDGSGGWTYTLLLDIDGRGALDELSVRARWDRRQAGRADARVTLGDPPHHQAFLRECWNPFLLRTYFEMPRFGATCPGQLREESGMCLAGQASFCVFDDLFQE